MRKNCQHWVECIIIVTMIMMMMMMMMMMMIIIIIIIIIRIIKLTNNYGRISLLRTAYKMLSTIVL
jgi:hypothetical protein